MALADALTDAERLKRAKTDRSLALDLEACVSCGYCSEACHFHQSTQDPQYSPSRKLDLLRCVHAREASVFSPLRDCSTSRARRCGRWA